MFFFYDQNLSINDTLNFMNFLCFLALKMESFIKWAGVVWRQKCRYKRVKHCFSQAIFYTPYIKKISAKKNALADIHKEAHRAIFLLATRDISP